MSFVPPFEGNLAKWQLAIGVTALFNTFQNFVTVKLTRKVYNAPPPGEPVTSLQARTFAVWTLTSAVVRLYAAYHIQDKVIYDMALMTYLIAFVHFSSEIFIFRTAKLNVAVLSPVVVSTTSLIWMIAQYDFYVKK